MGDRSGITSPPRGGWRGSRGRRPGSSSASRGRRAGPGSGRSSRFSSLWAGPGTGPWARGSPSGRLPATRSLVARRVAEAGGVAVNAGPARGGITRRWGDLPAHRQGTGERSQVRRGRAIVRAVGRGGCLSPGATRTPARGAGRPDEIGAGIARRLATVRRRVSEAGRPTLAGFRGRV